MNIKVGDSVKATRITPKRGKTNFFGFVTKILDNQKIEVEYYRGMSQGYNRRIFEISEVVLDDFAKGYIKKEEN